MQLEDSLREVLAQKELVIERFYSRFLAENPEVAVFFEGMDMKKQSLMLSAALIVSESHFREDLPTVEFYLQVLGKQHHEAGVPRELFSIFRDCLIATISQCQESWSDELADSWKAAIDKATTTMFEGYEETSNTGQHRPA